MSTRHSLTVLGPTAVILALILAACGGTAPSAVPSVAPATPSPISSVSPSLATTPSTKPVAVTPAGWATKTDDSKRFTIAVPSYVFVRDTATFIKMDGMIQKLEDISLVLYDRRPDSRADGLDTIQLGMPPSGAKYTADMLDLFATNFNPIDDIKGYKLLGTPTPFEVAAGRGLLYSRIIPKAEFGSDTDLAYYVFFIATKDGVLLGQFTNGITTKSNGEAMLQSMVNSIVVK